MSENRSIDHRSSDHKIHYECKYTPVELIEAFGGEPELLNRSSDTFRQAEILGSPNLCGFGKSVIETAIDEHIKELFLVNCCDTIRSAADIIADAGDTGFLYTMDLPHCMSQCSRELMTAHLEDFAMRYGEHTGLTFDPDKFRQAFTTVEWPDGPYIAVIGARMSDELFEMVENTLPLPCRNLSCVRGRDLGASRPPETDDFHRLMDWYAGELLAQTPCMRMEDVTGRRRLFSDPDLAGVIYHTLKFCDFYSFEYSRVKDDLQVPMLKIETDFNLQSSGQLLTRLEAFGETLRMSAGARFSGISGKKESRAPEGPAAGPACSPEDKPGAATAPEAGTGPEAYSMLDADATLEAGKKYFAGVDSGSTSTDIVIMDEACSIVTTVILPTGAGAENSAARGVAAALEKAGLTRDDLAALTATGYGRGSIQMGDSQVTEITCHARGAHYLDPDVRTVIDIGGQDSKVISLDPSGSVKNFVMNDKCAAGTGRFLDNMARTLEMDLDQMSQRGLEYKEDITISSMCTVFAESEVVSLIAKNKSADDIVHGLNKSVAAKTGTLVARVGGQEKYMMTGGVSRNRGLVKALEEELGCELVISPYSQLCGAIGAALFARDSSIR